jgi:hypothetical protein
MREGRKHGRLENPCPAAPLELEGTRTLRPRLVRLSRGNEKAADGAAKALPANLHAAKADG